MREVKVPAKIYKFDELKEEVQNKIVSAKKTEQGFFDNWIHLSSHFEVQLENLGFGDVELVRNENSNGEYSGVEFNFNYDINCENFSQFKKFAKKIGFKISSKLEKAIKESEVSLFLINDDSEFSLNKQALCKTDRISDYLCVYDFLGYVIKWYIKFCQDVYEKYVASKKKSFNPEKIKQSYIDSGTEFFEDGTAYKPK